MWQEIGGHAKLVLDVLQSAVHHRLSASVAGLAPMAELWMKFSENVTARGEKLGFQHWQHLLGMKVAWRSEGGIVNILVLAPTIMRNSRPLRLLQLESSRKS